MIASANAGSVFGDPSHVGCAIVSVSGLVSDAELDAGITSQRIAVLVAASAAGLAEAGRLYRGRFHPATTSGAARPRESGQTPKEEHATVTLDTIKQTRYRYYAHGTYTNTSASTSGVARSHQRFSWIAAQPSRRCVGQTDQLPRQTESHHSPRIRCLRQHLQQGGSHCKRLIADHSGHERCRRFAGPSTESTSAPACSSAAMTSRYPPAAADGVRPAIMVHRIYHCRQQQRMLMEQRPQRRQNRSSPLRQSPRSHCLKQYVLRRCSHALMTHLCTEMYSSQCFVAHDRVGTCFDQDVAASTSRCSNDRPVVAAHKLFRNAASVTLKQMQQLSSSMVVAPLGRVLLVSVGSFS